MNPVRRFKDFFNPRAALEGGWAYKPTRPVLSEEKKKKLMETSGLETPRSTLRAIAGVMTPYWTKASVPERLMGAALLATSLFLTWYAVQITVEFGQWQSGLTNTAQQLFQAMISDRAGMLDNVLNHYPALHDLLTNNDLLHHAMQAYPDATKIMYDPAFAELLQHNDGLVEALQGNPTMENLFMQFPDFKEAVSSNPDLLSQLSAFREEMTGELMKQPNIQEQLKHLLELAGGDFFKSMGHALTSTFNSVSDAYRNNKFLAPLNAASRQAWLDAWDSKDLITIALKFTGMSIVSYKSAQYMALRWRAWTTGYYTNRWLHAKAYSRLKNSFSNIDHPGQRLQQDPSQFTAATVSLMTGVLSSAMTFTSFFGMLWGLGPVMGVNGGFALIGAAYAASLTALTVGVGHKLPWIDRSQQRREAALRKALDSVDNNADLIAQNGTEDLENALIKENFKPVITNSLRQIGTQVKLIVVDATAGNVSIPIPYLVASFAGVAAGTASMGTIQTLNYAFNRVTSALSFIVNRFDQISAWMATAQRMYLLDQGIEASHYIEEEKRQQSLKTTEPPAPVRI